MMLEEITFSELRTDRKFRMLRLALQYFLIINGMVYILNNYLFEAELMKVFFGEVHIGADAAMLVFYISLMVSVLYILFFFATTNKVFSFHTNYHEINIPLSRLSFKEKESFISTVEEAKNERHLHLHKR
jgi:hypothetical protein